MSVHEDRRDVKTQRIPFEAIVEIGGASDQAAFEAQGVDLSAMGMHLRTAYLPDIGQPLLCRFDGAGQEISAEASVVWRREGSRGGEFGIQFTNLDLDNADALRQMCGVAPRQSEQEHPRHEVDPGTRVRLHIDGLGSPMKARVRGATDDELLVGSNLEFLKVGRSIELEDVDRGGKRPAHIDRVDVEIDRVSKVPQLIVTLRYDDATGETASVMAGGARVGRAEDVRSAPAEGPRSEMAEETPGPAASDVPNDDDMDAARQMKSKLGNAAAAMVPVMARLGSRAKTTASLLLAKAFERSRGGAGAPRRTTAPPPTGALHASGKRVIREGSLSGESADELPRPSRVSKKAMMMGLGGTTGLAVVLLAVALRKPSTPPPAANATPEAEPTAAANALAAADTASPPPGTGAPQANVPLFGATTMSTTDPFAAPTPGQPPAPPTAMASSFGAVGGSDFSESAAIDEGDDGKSESKSKTKVLPFTHGKVSHPVILRLKTDGTITAMHGMRTPTGFTVSLPGRHAPESTSGLTSRDPRIASMHVNSGSKGTEVSVQFKDGVPPYAVRAKGHDVVISLGRPALGEDDDAKPAATAKKANETEHTRHRAKRD
jgi:PilZ domain